jgi:RNA polymerase sigma-70 factor (ECF subfamily)
MDNTNLITRCQLGDVSSFSELYRLYSKKALGTAYLIAGQKSLAEDIVHEAFIQCFKSIKNLKNIETFDIWFYKIVTRTGWSVVRKNKTSLFLEDIEGDASLVSKSSEDSLDNAETKYIIYEALGKLSMSLRTVVILHYFNDMAIKDIAKVLGCFEGTVKSRLHNAKKQLKNHLSADIIGEVLKTDYIGKECTSHGE